MLTVCYRTELSEEMAATVVKFLSTIFAVGKNKKVGKFTVAIKHFKSITKNVV